MINDLYKQSSLCREFPIEEHVCPILSNEMVNEEYRLMVVEAPVAAESALPGQFFHLLCPAINNEQPYLRRPMSIYRIDREAGHIAFLYKVTGGGTRSLAKLTPGDSLNALGPLGKGFSLPSGVSHVLIVARGVGLATLAPLATYAKRQGVRVTAVLSARHRELLMSQDEFSSVGAKLIEVSDDYGNSAPESLNVILEDKHSQDPFDYIATCGSNRLLQLAKTLCKRWNIPGKVALEAHMGCGTGMCYACVAPILNESGKKEFKRVCLDGPVFDVGRAMGW